MQPQQAANGKAMYKLSSLLEAVINSQAQGKVKYKYFRKVLGSLSQRFGSELLGSHFSVADKSFLPGKVADCLGVLMKHWRRVTATEENWNKLCKTLEEHQANVLTRVYKKTQGDQKAGGRKLKEHRSDVTMDSEGFPAILQEAEDLSAEDEDTTSSGKDAWRDKVKAAKRPAASMSGDVAFAAKKKPAAKPTAAKAPGSCLGLDQPLHIPSLSMGGGKSQTYIQHCPDSNWPKRKVLVAACTKTQAEKTSKSHRELIEELYHFHTKEGNTKGSVLKARDALLKKYSK
eukprot:Skav211903  [mRNA]  locus=scaffold4079:995:1858:- [translate_table: standard]